MNEQDCENWVNHVKSRLVKMVDHRPFVFRNTKRKIAEEYLGSRKQFMGMSDNDLQTLEHKLAIPLPVIFRVYLRLMGRQQGLIFWGSESNPDEFLDYRMWAEEIFQEEQISSFLTPNSVIFMFHQGFAFRYFDVISPYDDTPVWKYIQGYAPVVEAKSFKDFIEGEISRLEELDNKDRDRGGFYLIVTDEGAYRAEFPESSDEQPLLIGDHFIE